MSGTKKGERVTEEVVQKLLSWLSKVSEYPTAGEARFSQSSPLRGICDVLCQVTALHLPSVLFHSGKLR